MGYVPLRIFSQLVASKKSRVFSELLPKQPQLAASTYNQDLIYGICTQPRLADSCCQKIESFRNARLYNGPAKCPSNLNGFAPTVVIEKWQCVRLLGRQSTLGKFAMKVQIVLLCHRQILKRLRNAPPFHY